MRRVLLLTACVVGCASNPAPPAVDEPAPVDVVDPRRPGRAVRDARLQELGVTLEVPADVRRTATSELPPSLSFLPLRDVPIVDRGCAVADQARLSPRVRALLAGAAP